MKDAASAFPCMRRDSHADQRITAFALNPVPEPAEWALMLAGLGLVGAAVRRHRKSAA